MTKYILLIFCFLVSLTIRAQEDEINPNTSLGLDHFLLEISEEKDTIKLKSNLNDIIKDFNVLYKENYYKSIELNCVYLTDEKYSFDVPVKVSSYILSYLVNNGLIYDNLSIRYTPKKANPFLDETPIRIMIFYNEWNGKYRDGAEPQIFQKKEISKHESEHCQKLE